MRDKMISELELKVDMFDDLDFDVISEKYKKLYEKVDKRLKEIKLQRKLKEVA